MGHSSRRQNRLQFHGSAGAPFPLPFRSTDSRVRVALSAAKGLIHEQPDKTATLLSQT